MDISQELVGIAKKHAEQLAAIDSKRSISYYDLDKLSSVLALDLIQAQSNQKDRVILVVDRSIYALVGIVASIKAGMAYVPFECDLHDMASLDHIPYIKCGIFLTLSAFEKRLKREDNKPVILLDREIFDNTELREISTVNKNNLIYTIFTSGSTGASKGVDITRKNVWHYTSSMMQLLQIDRPFNYAYVSSFSADLGNTALFLSLFTGGCIHFINNETRRNPLEFQSYLARFKIDILKITPSHFMSLCGNILTPFQLEWLIFGGENLSVELARFVFNHELARNVANHYGPTETTIGVGCFPICCSKELPETGSIPLKPLGKTVFELVDQSGAFVTEIKNAEGELLVGGPSVGRGYYNDQEQTNKKFFEIPNREWKKKYYATGDRFRRNAEGNYEFICRIDRQLKIKGYRIDPETIESIILQHPQVKASAVFALDLYEKGHFQLVAAVIPDTASLEDAFLIKKLQSLMKQQLPVYMIPSRIELFHSLPITKNGKTDYVKLSSLFKNGGLNKTCLTMSEFINNDDHDKNLITAAWSRFVGYPPTSLEDNFYDVGGDSILAIQLLSTLQNDGIFVSAKYFFENPTFQVLLSSVRREPSVPHPFEDETFERNLSPIQLWFFEKFPSGVNHWCQTILIDLARPICVYKLQAVVDQLIEIHPILSTIFTKTVDGWVVSDKKRDNKFVIGVTFLEPMSSIDSGMSSVYSEINLNEGALFRVHVFHQDGKPDRLALVCHHLVVDGVSWRILLDDLTRLYDSASRGKMDSLVLDSKSYWTWSKQLRLLAITLESCIELSWWDRFYNMKVPLLKTDFVHGSNTEASTNVVWISYSEHTTYLLLHDLPRRFVIKVQDILLTTFARSVAEILKYEYKELLVDVESHGRHLFSENQDLNRAVGWFTSLFPFSVEIDKNKSLISTIEIVHHNFKSIPDNGIGYGIRKYLLAKDEDDSHFCQPEICFNYLGHFKLNHDFDLGWHLSNEFPGMARLPESDRLYKLKLTGRVEHSRLILDLSYSRNFYTKQTIEKIANHMLTSIASILTDKKTDVLQHLPNILHTENSSTGLLTYVPEQLKCFIKTKKILSREQIFLTGVTGFVGIYILRELLNSTQATIYCLVRAKFEEYPSIRLIKLFQWYFPSFDVELVKKQVVILEGDVKEPYFGLQEESYLKLADKIDVVFHMAADVRLHAPIAELRKVNVQGTNRIVEFCSHGKRKHLHFLSTLSVAGISPSDKKAFFTENDLQYGQDFMTPYERSKYEAEIIVREFLLTGGDACIYRTGSVLADATGVFQINFESNRVLQSLNTYILAGALPDREEDLLICPVDTLARAITRIALAPGTRNGTFHITPSKPFMHNQLVGFLKALGYNISLVSPKKYLEILKNIESKYPKEVALARLWAVRPNRGVNIDSARTEKYLYELGETIQSIDNAWFSNFINVCIKRGCLLEVEKSQLNIQKELA